MSPPSPSDRGLLDCYLRERSEPSFRALVDAFMPVVWSAARRITCGNLALAEEVTQSVFTLIVLRHSSMTASPFRYLHVQRLDFVATIRYLTELSVSVI
jgi:hypothetical protein